MTLLAILGSEMIGNRNIITKRFGFEERVLIGWLANIGREPANQDAYLKVQHLCISVKVTYHFRPEYNSELGVIEYLYYGRTWAMFGLQYNGLGWKKRIFEVLVDYSKGLLPSNEASKLIYSAKNYIRISDK